MVRSSSISSGSAYPCRILISSAAEKWGPQANREIVADLKTANGQDAREHQGAFEKNGNVGSAAADVDQRDPHLAFGFGEHRLACRHRLQHQRVDANTGSLHAAHQIADRRRRP